jgi:hypothetical protein
MHKQRFVEVDDVNDVFISKVSVATDFACLASMVVSAPSHGDLRPGGDFHLLTNRE